VIVNGVGGGGSMKINTLSILNLILISVSMAACTANKEITKAPSSKKDLGFIVSGSSKSEIQDSGLQYRIINEKHKLAEVYGSEKDIKAAFPGSAIEKNQMEAKYMFSEVDNEPANDQEKLEAFIGGCTDGETLSLLVKNKSENIIKDPISELTTSNMGEPLELEVVQLDGVLGPETQYYWVLSNVGLSRYEKYLYEGKEFNLKLTGVGQYQISVIVKDKNNACGISPYLHWVTSNDPILDEASESLPSNLDTHHLEEAGLLEGKTERSDKVIVAVIDTGANYNHPGLNEIMFRNENEIPGNDIDDDGNGFVDDYSGFDFFSQDSNPMDDMGHGSHVSGLIAGLESGVTSNALILPIKVGSGSGVDSASLAGAVLYAVDQGAKIINLSLGGYGEPTMAEVSAYEYANDNDVILVIASGNGHPVFGFGLNLDRQPIYPASLGLDNMIVVSASSKSAKPLTTYSNFGSVVDIVAPGGDSNDRLSSVAIVNNLDIYYTEMNGTSMAAPIVAGAAAEILSIDSSLSPQEVKKILVDSGTKDKMLEGLTKNAIHLNIDEAVKLAEAI